MKKIFIAILVLISATSYGQTHRNRANGTLQRDSLAATNLAAYHGNLVSMDSTGKLIPTGVDSAFSIQDTTTLYTFNSGHRIVTDTTLFTDSTLYGSFFWGGNDTMVIVQIRAVMNGGANDTLGYNLWYNDTINVIGTAFFIATEPLTSTTTGADADADNFNGGSPIKIPPNHWVWMKTPTVVAGRKPWYLSVSIIGYRKRVN